MAMMRQEWVLPSQIATAGQTITLSAVQLPKGFDHADVLVEEISGATTLGFVETGTTLTVYQAQSKGGVTLVPSQMDEQTRLSFSCANLFSDPDCTKGRLGTFASLDRNGVGDPTRITSAMATSAVLALKRDAVSGTGTYSVTIVVYWNHTSAASSVKTLTAAAA